MFNNNSYEEPFDILNFFKEYEPPNNDNNKEKESFDFVAKSAKMMFDSFIDAGFEPAMAYDLVKSLILGMMMAFADSKKEENKDE